MTNTVHVFLEQQLRNIVELEGSTSFIPVQRIFCRFVPAYDVIDEEHVLVVCSVPSQIPEYILWCNGGSPLWEA